MGRLQLIIIAFVLFTSFNPLIALSTAAGSHVQEILNSLYVAAGQFDVAKPGLQISTDNKRVAAYYPARNVIIIDKLIYDLCRSMEDDSSAAIAYIISHELSHAFQSELVDNGITTNFLSYDRDFPSLVRFEKVADVQGVFTAYLAGFDCSGVIPRLLPKIYEAYNLGHGIVPGYPPLDERMQVAGEVLDITSLLIDLFEATSYLLMEKYYQLAVANYQYILQYYQGSEIYNNLGLAYQLAAQDHYYEKTDKFVHPFQLDVETQMEKIQKARGEITLDEEQYKIRVKLLENALSYFEKSIEQNPDYEAARINKASCLNLLDRPDDAFEFCQEQLFRMMEGDEDQGEWHLVTAISFAQTGDILNAQYHFTKAKDAEDLILSEMARYNLDVLQFRNFVLVEYERFDFPPLFQEVIAGIELPRMSNLERNYLDDELYVRRLQLGHSNIISFGDLSGNIISFVRYRNPLYSRLMLFDEGLPSDQLLFSNLYPTPSGYIIKDWDNHLAIELNAKGAIQEVVRSFVHR